MHRPQAIFVFTPLAEVARGQWSRDVMSRLFMNGFQQSYMEMSGLFRLRF